MGEINGSIKINAAQVSSCTQNNSIDYDRKGVTTLPSTADRPVKNTSDPILAKIVKLLDGASDIKISIKITSGLKIQIIANYKKNGVVCNNVVIEKYLKTLADGWLDTVLYAAQYLSGVIKGSLNYDEIKSAAKLVEIIKKYGFEKLSARLLNPDLTEYDRLLFGKYLIALGRGDDKGIEDTKRLIKAKLIILNSEPIKSYTGKEDLAYLWKEGTAAGYLVEAIGSLNKGDSSKWFNKKEYQDIVVESSISFLSPNEQDFVRDYLKLPMSEKEYYLNDLISQYQTAYWGSTWGTPERALYGNNLTILENIAYEFGIDVKDPDLKYAQQKYPKELAFIKKVDLAIGSPESSDDKQIRKDFLLNFKTIATSFYTLLESENPDLEDIKALNQIYGWYEYLVNDPNSKLNINREDLLKIENNIKALIIKSDHAFNKDLFVCRPEELPMKDGLQQIMLRDGYSYYDYIKDNLNYIVFRSKDDGSKYVQATLGGGSDGGTYFGGGVIYINVKGLDLNKLTKSQIGELFAAIIHETRHSEWSRTLPVDDKVINKGLPNEASAYEFDAIGLKQLSKQFPAFTSDVENTIYYEEELVKAAKSLIASNDFSKTQLDLDIYPTNIPYFKGFQYASSLSFISSKTIGDAADLYSNLIQEKLKLEDLTGLAKETVKGMLDKISPESKDKTYIQSLADYKNAFKTFYNDDHTFTSSYLDSMIAFSLPHKIIGAGNEVQMFDAAGNITGTVPKGSEVKIKMSPPKYWGDKEYYEIKYNDKIGYVSADNIE